MLQKTELDKFHTITFKTYCLSKIRKDEKALLVLLKYYMGVSSQKYGDEEAMTRACEDLYDLTYSVRISQFGQYYYLVCGANAIDPKYIDDGEYTMDKITDAFLGLSEPLIRGGSLDKKVFSKAKKQMLLVLAKNEKNPEFLATEDAMAQLFPDSVRGIRNRELRQQVQKITPKMLLEYLQGFSSFERGTFAVGCLEGTECDVPFTMKPHGDFLYRERITPGKSCIRSAKTDSMYLRVFYDPGIFSTDKLFYAASLFSYVLGGSSYSHLFRIVREKYGMCYSVDSDYMGASGLILISAVIDKKNLSLVLGYIREALDTVLSYVDLEKTKRLFILSHRASYDAPGAYISDMFLKSAFPLVSDTKSYEKRIEGVTMEDLKKVSELLKEPYFVYGYGGDGHE